MLIREVDNHFDQRTVWIDWQGEKLGHVPVRGNVTASRLLGRRENYRL